MYDVIRSQMPPGWSLVTLQGEETGGWLAQIQASVWKGPGFLAEQKQKDWIETSLKTLEIADSRWNPTNRTQVEHGSLLLLLARWVPDPVDVERVLWRNPARLFGFPDRFFRPASLLVHFFDDLPAERGALQPPGNIVADVI